jgi:hypothetical protein
MFVYEARMTDNDELDDFRALRDRFWKKVEATPAYAAWREADRSVKALEARLHGSSSSLAIEASPGKITPTVKIACEIINARGAPIATEDLLEEMQKRGVVFDGAHPANNLRSTLSKSPVLENILIGPNRRDDRAWWFAGRPIPEATEHKNGLDNYAVNTLMPNRDRPNH